MSAPRYEPSDRVNEFGQPIGAAMPGWRPPPPIARRPLQGRLVALEPLDVARHGAALFAALDAGAADRRWTYVPYGPFEDRGSFNKWLAGNAASADPLWLAVIPQGGSAAGLTSFMRMVTAQGTIELGHLNLGPPIEGTAAATEALHLMLREAFALGYRRVEWKCDSLHAESRRAASRLGFRFEGVFRHAVVYKGRNRDSAWYAITDGEWPALRAIHERWLDSGNFDADGRQRTRLSELTAARDEE